MKVLDGITCKEIIETSNNAFWSHILKSWSWFLSDKVHIFISVMPISSPNPMFDELLESSYRDDSNKWSNTGFGEEITQVE